jgi:protein-S-isoprenylcysteine O-methyltransferase Ste14
MYSVAKYFGMDRAYGIDHFDPSYRTKPFVKQGMFKYTNNAMYKFGFLIFWAIAFAFLSKAALISAAFSHLYIWVHFYFTELPDIKHIYGNPSKEPV